MADFVSAVRTFGSITIGALLILVNIPVFSVIITHKRLRRIYTVLGSVILLNGLTGIATLATGIRRVITLTEHKTSVAITNKDCILNFSYFLRFALNSLNGTGLLLVSVDRFIVAAFPLFYFRHQYRLALLLMLVPYTFTILFLMTAFAATLLLPAYPVDVLCGLENILHPSAFTACLCLHATAALSSTMVMIAVVFIMRRRIKHVARNHKTVAHGDISAFVRNQSRFTVTMLLSSTFTVALFVAPTCYQLATQVLSLNNDVSEVVALYLSYINAFNMVCIVVIRQEDIKVCLMALIKRKQSLQLTNELRVVTVIDGSRKAQQSLTKPT